ncbi:hypothetical protein MT325_M686L [Paramecium bursaria chlorella virus MT325]|uniref:Uncharacterized protein M686L n=1 Tax=Paramecium bursaria Chlorella virus MT325 TaxID=346932 RepID=A7IV66_PBCVM|nr:hypothetical protein MT325_M686L [Paramecium bursaria chlorella virus MT325]
MGFLKALVFALAFLVPKSLAQVSPPLEIPVLPPSQFSYVKIVNNCDREITLGQIPYTDDFECSDTVFVQYISSGNDYYLDLTESTLYDTMFSIQGIGNSKILTSSGLQYDKNFPLLGTGVGDSCDDGGNDEISFFDIYQANDGYIFICSPPDDATILEPLPKNYYITVVNNCDKRITLEYIPDVISEGSYGSDFSNTKKIADISTGDTKSIEVAILGTYRIEEVKNKDILTEEGDEIYSTMEGSDITSFFFIPPGIEKLFICSITPPTDNKPSPDNPPPTNTPSPDNPPSTNNPPPTDNPSPVKPSPDKPSTNKPPPANVDQDNQSSSGVPIGIIVGASVGGVVLIGAIIVGIWWCKKHRKNRMDPALDYIDNAAFGSPHAYITPTPVVASARVEQDQVISGSGHTVMNIV